MLVGAKPLHKDVVFCCFKDFGGAINQRPMERRGIIQVMIAEAVIRLIC